MATTSWPVYSPFAREHFGRGKKEGRAEGEAEAILTILDARGIDVPDDACARIRACTDQEQLMTWIKRAAVATSISDLFD